MNMRTRWSLFQTYRYPVTNTRPFRRFKLHVFCMMLLAACLSLTAANAQNNWTGAAGTDWATAENWSTSLVPTATDNVIIPATANQPVLSAAGALAKTVEVQSGATLTIQSTGILAVNGSKTTSYYGSITAFFNNGTVQNNGILLIGNVSSVGAIGLLNLATFNNNTGGHISIDRSTGDGLLNASGTFTNMSSLTIGAAANVGIWGVENYGTFKNNTGGQISTDRSTVGGFGNREGVFTNAAAITIGAVASVGTNGLANYATFSNNTGGQISIDRTTNYGLYNNNSFTNAATITIGAVASVGTNGIYNVNTFNNNTGGQISIDRSTNIGLDHRYGTFTNAGTITIGAAAGVGTYGLENFATFNNSGCAVLALSAALNNSGSITNAGLFTVNTNQPHSNTALTNNGVISYPQGNAIPNVTNNALIASPASSTCVPVISPALQIAAGNNFVVGTTWYQDAALSTVAGTYTPNTFTGMNLAVGSSYTVYFTVNDPVNGCTRTVSLYATVNGTSEWYKDADGDGYSDGTVQLACDRPTGYKPGSELTAMSVDCNDDALAINPGASEVCDGIDNNCDGSIDEGFTDTDGDALADCADPDDDNDGVLDEQDCAPLDATTWRTGNVYADSDGDGYGSGTAISMCYGTNTPTGYSTVGEDCNDGPAAGGAAIHPGATEVCDGIDNNCDGNIDEGFTDTDGDAFANCVDADDDNDGILDENDCAPLDATKWRTGNFYADGDHDGYGSGTAVSLCYGTNTPTGYSTVGGDCNDANAAINPSAVEICGNGIDDNCNGQVDENCSCVNVTVSASTISCYGGLSTITVTASGGKAPYKYKLSGSSNFQSINYFTVGAGTYSVTVMDKTGCTRTVSNIVITQPAPLTLTLVQKTDVTCKNGINGKITVNASGGTAPYSYKLKSGVYGSSGIFQNLKAGTYTVTAKDAKGCIKLLSVVIKNGTGPCDTAPLQKSASGMDADFTKQAANKPVDFSVTPNPASTLVHIAITGYTGNVVIQLADIHGRKLLERKLQEKSSIMQQEIDISHFANGVYLVTVIDEKSNRKTIKLVVQH